jgi:hypothetical protein
MPVMKSDAMGLLARAASTMKRSDPGTAYAIYELANNLRLLMRGEATLAEWNNCYVGADREPLDIEKLCPIQPPDYGMEESDEEECR